MKVRITSVVPETEWPVVSRLFSPDVEVTDIVGEGRPAKLVVETVTLNEDPVCLRSDGFVAPLSKLISRTGYTVNAMVAP